MTAPDEQRVPREGKRWTRLGVVRALRTYKFFVGRAPTPTDWSFADDSEWPSPSTVLSLFGSLDSAIAAAEAVPAPTAT